MAGAGIGFDLFAELEQHARDLRLPDSISTCSGHQPRAGSNELLGVRGEKNEKVQLLLRQLHLFAANGYLAGLWIDARIARLDDLGWCGIDLWPWLAPALNAGAHLLEAEPICHFIYPGSQHSRQLHGPLFVARPCPRPERATEEAGHFRCQFRRRQVVRHCQDPSRNQNCAGHDQQDQRQHLRCARPPIQLDNLKRKVRAKGP